MVGATIDGGLMKFDVTPGGGAWSGIRDKYASGENCVAIIEGEKKTMKISISKTRTDSIQVKEYWSNNANIWKFSRPRTSLATIYNIDQTC